MLTILGVCFFIIFSGSFGGTVAEKATVLLQAVKSGNKQAAVEAFGDNSCNCAPPGGYELQPAPL